MNIDDAVGRIIEGNAKHEPIGMRRFIRYCGGILNKTLPPEAKEWIIASEKYDSGQLTEDQITTIRVNAWNYHNMHQRTTSKVGLAALRVAMYGLWTDIKGSEWDIAFDHFIEFCQEAGISDDCLMHGINTYLHKDSL